MTAFLHSKTSTVYTSLSVENTSQNQRGILGVPIVYESNVEKATDLRDGCIALKVPDAAKDTSGGQFIFRVAGKWGTFPSINSIVQKPTKLIPNDDLTDAVMVGGNADATLLAYKVVGADADRKIIKIADVVNALSSYKSSEKILKDFKNKGLSAVNALGLNNVGHIQFTGDEGLILHKGLMPLTFTTVGTDANAQASSVFSGELYEAPTTPSCLVEIKSTLGALVVSRMKTSEKNALTPTKGMVLYDTDLNEFQFYQNGMWKGSSLSPDVAPTAQGLTFWTDNTGMNLSSSSQVTMQTFLGSGGKNSNNSLAFSSYATLTTGSASSKIVLDNAIQELATNPQSLPNGELYLPMNSINATGINNNYLLSVMPSTSVGGKRVSVWTSISGVSNVIDVTGSYSVSGTTNLTSSLTMSLPFVTSTATDTTKVTFNKPIILDVAAPAITETGIISQWWNNLNNQGNNTANGGAGVTSTNLGLVMKNHQILAKGIYTISSREIKNIHKDQTTVLQEAKDLFSSFEFKKYTHKDTTKHGNGSFSGVIAEQVQEVAPHFVTSLNSFVPNIILKGMCYNDSDDKTKFSINLEGGFPEYKVQIDDKIQIMFEEVSDEEGYDEEGYDEEGYDEEGYDKGVSLAVYEAKVTGVSSDVCFTVSSENPLPLEVFVYGTEKPCPAVDKEKIFETGMIVLQDLTKTVADLSSKVKELSEGQTKKKRP